MKRITIFNYNFDRATDEEIKKLKWKHNVPFEGDAMKVVKKIYEKTNLNIFIQRYRGDNEGKVTIFVTMNNRFGQR
jgi:hypothetical protein